MEMSETVEFIESYIKVQGGDYQWNDNHGELVRCKDCKHYMTIHCTCDGCCISDDWFCADGERAENARLSSSEIPNS